MRKVSREGKIKAYFLHLDIKTFFFSIHKPKLISMLDAKHSFGKNETFNKTLKDLTHKVILHDIASTAKSFCSTKVLESVPQHKKLGFKGKDYGLPIGNLTSQLFANIYLNTLDQYIKCTLGARYYVRYMDDFVLLHKDMEQLLKWHQLICSFAKEKLFLDIHQKSALAPISKGIDFVGYIIRPHYILPRRRVFKHANKRISDLEKHLQPTNKQSSTNKQNYSIWPIDYKKVERIRASLSSYIGHFQHSSSFKLIQKLFFTHPILNFYLQLKYTCSGFEGGGGVITS